MALSQTDRHLCAPELTLAAYLGHRQRDSDERHSAGKGRGLKHTAKRKSSYMGNTLQPSGRRHSCRCPALKLKSVPQ